MSIAVEYKSAVGALRTKHVHASRVCVCVSFEKAMHYDEWESRFKAEPFTGCGCDGTGEMPHAEVKPGTATAVSPAQLGAIMRTTRLMREASEAVVSRG